ncbi:MAG: NlpC/P60 family protein, partial [Eubacteriales bacterium]|nr:NlpC/P60 family protein [Eubacteriales bacterium]
EDIDEIIRKLIKRIQDLAELPKITLDQKEEIQAIRNIYDSLTDEQREQITNYEKFKKMEEELKALLGEASDELTDGSDIDELASQIGDAVYYTNYVSNLHAGKEFYLNSLKDNYGLSFSDDFAKVMNEIEEEYKDKYKLRDVSDQKSAKTTSSEDVLLVRNWQDILAIYVYEEMLDGKSSFTLDSSAKKDLSKIFAEMNPVERNKSDITKVAYGNRHINYYIKKHNVDTDGREVLKKYTETDCKLLCAVVTASKGFVRESVGENVSEERVNVISAAYSLIGEVGYFYGGKSNVIGTDDSWGQAEKVTAEGSTSTGTLRAYGLDCSGFVTWSVINGYQNTDMQDVIGDGTSEQWEKANVVSEKDAQPGDLVFLAGPERTGADNHVGIICGKTDAGDWIAVHCSSAKNGVTVGEAYSASFRYIRQPSFYPSENEMQQMAASGSAVSDLLTDHGTDGEDSAQVSMIVLVDDADVEPFDPSELPAHASVSAILQTEDTDTETSAASVPEEESQDAAASSDTAETTETPVLVDNSIVEPF